MYKRSLEINTLMPHFCYSKTIVTKKIGGIGQI